MENSFRELIVDELDSINGGGINPWDIFKIKSFIDAIIEFGKGFASGYQSGNSYGS